MPSLDDQLAWMDARYEELGVACSQNEVIADLPRWQQLMRERAGLEEAVQDWRGYVKLREEIASTEELADSPDFADMAEEELPQLKERERKLRDRLKLYLIPRDPDDDRNVVMEIRAGAGGEEAGLFGALGHVGDAGLDALVRLGMGDGPAFPAHLALASGDQAHQALEQGGFAHPVAAEQAGDLADAGLERQPAQDVAAAVVLV